MDIKHKLDDSQFSKTLIGAFARVGTVDGVTSEGFIYVIDPLTKSVILTNKSRVTLVIGFSLKSLEVPGDVPYLDTEWPSILCVDVSDRRRRVVSWLKKHMLQVQEANGVLQIQEDVRIHPPYTVEQCESENEVVLERIIWILQQLPNRC